MDIAAKLDDIGKPAWIGLMVVGFILFWPIGLAILAFLIWSGRMGCWKRGHMSEFRKARGRWYGPCGGGRYSSGNSAFDEYRAETLRRLEDEQKEFMDFLDRLRQAKDRAEFEQFMAERRDRPQGPAPEAPEPQPRA
ncbi:Protein of unknown function [Tistlia consotensis]|uniref:DUF2852 domain-containing protein n=1 Tax=Tistlia consotensis USBA 355 TaxID=560819 RepID=A0A1Y6B7B3_9PROT|nr:DUF2852 domain-containing protein [Tistlia consotensis]SME88152.1 Protein of unknown function [Tistlia consotensis USBA 355]SNR24554.1 Protein of unknown function [Tistlia consotensis]